MFIFVQNHTNNHLGFTFLCKFFKYLFCSIFNEKKTSKIFFLTFLMISDTIFNKTINFQQDNKFSTKQ